MKSLESSEIYRKTTQLLTFYGHFTEKPKRHSEIDIVEKSEEEIKKEEEAIRRHVFLERDKKKFIEPIKLTSVNISFNEKNPESKGNIKETGVKSVINNKS